MRWNGPCFQHHTKWLWIQIRHFNLKASFVTREDDQVQRPIQINHLHMVDRARLPSIGQPHPHSGSYMRPPKGLYPKI